MTEEEAREHALEMALWLGALAAHGPVTVHRHHQKAWTVEVGTDRYDVIPPQPAVKGHGSSLLGAVRMTGRLLAVVIP